ncbi:hypothetical protein N7501_000029 [Penicillium viridicatum]|nr:hypothetical protein N7501_000029 [Penicillium viridicatum]
MTNLDSGNAWASLGRNGSIMVKHPEWYGLLPGIENDDGYEVFPVSVFHQLHCLRILREGYVALLGGKQRHDHIASHQDHCFDYLRQAIICSADLTLEKARVDEDGHRRATDGWGTEHRCKKWSEVEKVKLEYQWNAMDRNQYISEFELGNVEEQEPFMPSDERISSSTTPRNRGSIQHYSSVLAGVFFLLSSFAVVEIWRKPSEAQCVKRLNAWSPMLDAVQYRRVDFKNESNLSFMGTPTAHLEEKWDDLWRFGSLGIPETHLPYLNKSVSEYDWHHLPSELGGGIQAYFEGFHQIHCLNLVRQYTYQHEYDYSHVHAFVNPHVDILEHVEHCLEILRTKIMCEADTTLYSAAHTPERGVVVDRRSIRNCRNFSNIVEWANAHIVKPKLDRFSTAEMKLWVVQSMILS